ncbi:MAG TPA: protein kinase [Gemmataceae bacterium]|nr:protein kinase [Gemmataceae bacterium]
MPAILDCPAIECWQALLGDTVAATERENYERHLESCPTCQERLRRIEEDEDGLRTLGRRVGDPTVVPADPTLLQILTRLHGTKAPARIAPLEPTDLYFLRPSEKPGILGLLGDYEVLEVIGQGGMGVVLKAFEPALHRLVAIKVMGTALAGSATARRRFTREAQAAAAVCHDHIVTVHGVSEVDSLPYLVMQYVAGESLQDRLDREGPLTVAEIVRIGLQTASGLAAAHAQGLIHRDIKPANLLLENENARVKITDFGLARMADDVALTQDGVIAGTPEYMAPEQARGETVDHRADLFSLGSVLYACCTGSPPFHGSTALAVLRQINDEEPVSIRSLNASVPAWLEALIAQLMAKDAAQRFQSAAEVAPLLEGYRAHLRQPTTVASPDLPPLLPTPRAGGGKATRKSRIWPVVFVALVAGFVLGGAVWFLQVAAPVEQPRDKPLDYYHDFRNRPLPAELTPLHPEDSQLLRVEPEGLRITLPRTPSKYPGEGVGVQTTFGFQGDFEVTATVEVLQLAPPPSGHGAGVGIFVETGPQLAYLERFIFRNGQNAVLYGRRRPDPITKRPLWSQNGPPCPDNLLRLRLKRTGAMISYWWAPGSAGDDFEEVSWSRSEIEFGSDPVQYVRLTAGNGRTECPLDARLIDLRIRSGLSAGDLSAGDLPADDGPETSPRKTARMLWLVISLGIALLVGVGMAVWQIRRRQDDTPADPSAADQAANLDVVPASVSFACSGCGKRLRARAVLAGKKVKCPQCGQGVPVPSVQAGGEPE